MKLAPFLSPAAVVENLQAVDCKGVLTELSSLLLSTGGVPAGTNLVTILENREELGSTGIGHGVAIPHVRLKNLSSCRVAVGRSKAGVEFSAVDGQPVHLFFLFLSPENASGDHLKVLAHISRLLKKAHVRQALLDAGSREDMLKIIVSEDEED